MIRHLQARQKAWSAHNFGDSRPHWMMYGLMEELGEVARAKLKSEQGIRTGENHQQNLKKEIADVFIFLMGLCNSESIDLEDAIADRCVEVFARDWVKFPTNGMTE